MQPAQFGWCISMQRSTLYRCRIRPYKYAFRVMPPDFGVSSLHHKLRNSKLLDSLRAILCRFLSRTRAGEPGQIADIAQCDKVKRMARCSVAGCNEASKARGYCSRHYSSAWRRGMSKMYISRRPGACLVPGCDRDARGNGAAKGLCQLHYALPGGADG